MVKLHVKRGDESQFLVDTTVAMSTDELIEIITRIYNGRQKVHRICDEMEELVKHGTFLPPNMLGLTDEQVTELKLVDEWGETCTPSGGSANPENPDPIGRRNGKQPNEKMQSVLTRTIGEAKAAVSNKLVDSNTPINEATIKEQLDILRGACTIVYPMNLPPHDPIRMEFENKEDLSGTQAGLNVIEEGTAELWFCGKQILPGKQLQDFIGKNEKTKVIVKISKRGQGPPGREPTLTEEERKNLMMFAFKKQEEAKVSHKIFIRYFCFCSCFAISQFSQSQCICQITIFANCFTNNASYCLMIYDKITLHKSE